MSLLFSGRRSSRLETQRRNNTSLELGGISDAEATRRSEKRQRALSSENYSLTGEERKVPAVIDDDAPDAFAQKRTKKVKNEQKIKTTKLVRPWNDLFPTVPEPLEAPAAPTFFSVEAPPSTRPARKFCSICGRLAAYTCPMCQANFCCVRCNGVHKDSRCRKFVV